MHLVDTWQDKTSMLQSYHNAIRNHAKKKGNPAVTIDYSNLKVGDSVTDNAVIENKSRSC